MASFNSAETGLMAKYNANDTTLMVDGELMFGYATDTMITVAYDNDNVTVSQDPQGTAVASVNNKTGATITVNLNETSPSNAKLTELANTRGEFPLDLRQQFTRPRLTVTFQRCQTTPPHKTQVTVHGRSTHLTLILNLL